ncbi:MAG: transglycosylase domain-containing protein [Lacisediminihabitans sp.]
MSAQKFTPSGVFGAIAGLLGFSALAGVLVAAMITPTLALTSVTANNTIGVFDNLPDFIRLGTQSQQNTIYANRDGKPVQIASTFRQNRKEVGWNDVSQFVKDAVVAGEDRRFYDHGGVDITSVIRAALGNFAAGSVQSGSSTLDMQLVKNILVQQALSLPTQKERNAAYADAIKGTIDRKLKEMKLAIGLDKAYTKQQILLGYLNIVGFGGNTYGIESAAEQYFSVSAKDVTVAQAASLIAIVQQPNLQNLGDPKYYQANQDRRDQILDDMLQLKYISQDQYGKAITTKIKDEVKLSAPSNGCLYATDAQFACDYVTKLVPTLTSLGATAQDRQANWDKGGYRVYTSIDLNQQDLAQQLIDTRTPATETRFQFGSVANAVEAGTGRILVMAQNKKFDDSLNGGGPTTTAVNFSTDRPYGGSSGFPTGSTYKVFTLANWLQNGHGLNDLVNANQNTYNMSSFVAPCVGGFGGPPWSPSNDTRQNEGTITVVQALAQSVNNAFIGMALKLNLCDIRATAMSMGAHRADGAALKVDPSAILGINEIAPLTMAAAVATVGAGGLHCDPVIIDKITGPDGKDLPGQQKTCNQALTPDVAAGVAYAMAASMTRGTSTAANPRDGVPIVGKTGTTDTADHLWIMGSTTKVGLVVWTGNIVGHQSLRRIYVAGVRADLTRFPIFRTLMASFNANPAYRGGKFGVPSATMLGGSSQTVPSVVGQTAEQAKSVLESLQYVYAAGPTVPSALPVGRVVSTNPPAGTKTAIGDTVTVSTSDGTLAVTMPSDLVGKSRHDAVTELTGLGFSNITINWVAGTPADICKVKAATPAPGAAASKTDPVTLSVSNGNAVTPATDPGATLCPA